MQLSNLRIVNLRSVATLSLDFSSVTALLGGNNAGKSTVLRALQIFFETAPKIEDDDFHLRKEERISVTIEFTNLTPSELEELGSGVLDGRLTITRTFTKTKDDDHLQYSVTALAYPEFELIRAEQDKREKTRKFNEVREKYGLDPARSADDVEARLAAWEQTNKDKLTATSVRGFFGASNVAAGKIRKKTAVHFIPAVADATEQTSEAKRSPIIALLSEIARQVYENREEVKRFVETSNAEFAELVKPERFPQLSQISEKLTNTIQRYYKDSRLLANWESPEGVRVTFPQPIIRVEDGGFISGLQNVGHGLQRAALFSVIEFLASQVSSETEEKNFDQAQSDIVLLIEEPEIYQHPGKQQVIHDAFHQICKDFSAETGIRFQIVFTTHSEKFIGIQKFHSARIIRKSVQEGAVKHSCASVNIRQTSEFFAKLLGKAALADDSFEAKMHIFSRELCEGFFANKVILVEGVSDKAVLTGAYRSLGRSPDAEGIAIISAEGKTKMDKPLYIFRKLGIPVYIVFDSDSNKAADQRINANRLLQSIIGVEKPLDFPDGVFDHFASFGSNLEGYFKSVAGEKWSDQLEIFKAEYGLEKDDICKTPNVISAICANLAKEGKSFDRLNQIIGRVDALVI